VGKSFLTRQKPERANADLALADMPVPVNSTAKGCFGIIQVKEPYLLRSEQILHLFDNGLPYGTGTNVVPGLKEVSRVETKAHPVLQGHTLMNRCKLDEVLSDGVSLACRILKADVDGIPFQHLLNGFRCNSKTLPSVLV
jgi:hypothetical protein